MKLTKLIFLFTLAIAAVGCNKDDNNSDPYELNTTNFVDTYKMKFLEVKISETVTFSNGTTSTSTSTKVGSVFQNVNYVFNSDNSYTANGLYNTVTTVKEADGTTTVGDTVIVSLDESGTYSLNTTNEVVTLNKLGGDAIAFDITKYTETEMRLYSEVETTSNNIKTVTTTEYRFSR